MADRGSRMPRAGFISRRVVISAALVLGLGSVALATTPSATADVGAVPPPTYQAGDYAQGQALSILPAGENGLVNVPQAAAFELNGTRPPASDDQLAKYASLIYAPTNLDDSQLGRYYNDESFGIAPGNITRVETPSSSVPVAIYRDTHDVPHIYSSTSLSECRSRTAVRAHPKVALVPSRSRRRYAMPRFLEVPKVSMVVRGSEC